MKTKTTKVKMKNSIKTGRMQAKHYLQIHLEHLVYIRKYKRSQINDLSFDSKKKRERKLNLNRTKQIIKIRRKINEIENRKTT